MIFLISLICKLLLLLFFVLHLNTNIEGSGLLDASRLGLNLEVIVLHSVFFQYHLTGHVA